MAYVQPVTFAFNAAVRGYHVYRSNWSPDPDELLVCKIEKDNDFDPYAIKVCKIESDMTVRHLPREISRPTENLLLRGADITAKLIGSDYRRSPLLVTVVLTGNLNGNAVMKRYEELVTDLYSEQENKVKVGSLLKEETGEADISLLPRSQKSKKTSVVARRPKRNHGIRALFALNRNPPATMEEIPPKFVILEE